MNELTERIWERLLGVKSLSSTVRSDAVEKTGWTGETSGTVEVRRLADDCLVFIEAGAWRTAEGRHSDFSNTYRWTRRGDTIRLEHLRFGADRPVHLVDLKPVAASRMAAKTPHVCAADLYDAALELGDELVLSWSITGPRKREAIECRYAGRSRDPAEKAVTKDRLARKARGSATVGT